MKALIIEDNPDVIEAVSLCLQLRWPDVDISAAVEGLEGIKVLNSGSFDIIILDINLPDIDGFEVLARVRSFSNVPVLILTVRGKEGDQARGLETGADDYIVKPFRPRDLIARVNAILRRTHTLEPGNGEHSLLRGNLLFNLATNEVHLRDRAIKLTPREGRLLYILMKHAEETLSSSQILLEVWGKEQAGIDTLRTYIRRLRDKLKDNPPQVILNERGNGYRFVNPA